MHQGVDVLLHRDYDVQNLTNGFACKHFSSTTRERHRLFHCGACFVTVKIKKRFDDWPMVTAVVDGGTLLA